MYRLAGSGANAHSVGRPGMPTARGLVRRAPFNRADTGQCGPRAGRVLRHSARQHSSRTLDCPSRSPTHQSVGQQRSCPARETQTQEEGKQI